MTGEPATLTGLYFGAFDRFGARPVVMRVKRDGVWQEIAWQTLAARVAAISHGLLALGIAPGDRVAILSENRPEWAVADFAALAARAVDVPVYPTLTARQIHYLLKDSGARAVFVSTAEGQLFKALDVFNIQFFDPHISDCNRVPMGEQII